MRKFAIAGLVLMLFSAPAAAQSDSLATSAAAAAAAAADAARAARPAPAPAAAATVAAPPAEHSTDLAGHWTGTWTKYTDVLPVSVTFVKTDAGYYGSFDSDALQVAGIPFDDVSFTAPNAHFVLKGDDTTTVFDGTVASDMLTGSFTEGPAAGTFTLSRGAPPEAGLRTRDVTFKNGDVTLSGTLILPPESVAAGKHRAILFMQGSGPEARWANRYLAQKFAARGVVALIYDKRGVGQSTGDWRGASYGNLADDAVAGVRFLQRQPEVDRRLVGIYGHSQGGTIAPEVAEHAQNLDFVIASAASGLNPDATELYSVENALRLTALPPSEEPYAEAYVRQIVAVAYRGANRADLDATAARLKGRSWFFPPPPPDDPYWRVARNTAGYRPPVHWRHVHTRVMLVYGAHDMRVPPRESVAAIKAALAEGDAGAHVLRTWICQECDHTFTIIGQGLYNGWPKRVPDYADRLINFVLLDTGDAGAARQ